jgi:hypothetical protein
MEHRREGGRHAVRDGTTYPPNSALAILLEADRKLTAERRAAARLRGQPVMPAEKTARHAARASASIEVLDQLEALLADGRTGYRETTGMM